MKVVVHCDMPNRLRGLQKTSTNESLDESGVNQTHESTAGSTIRVYLGLGSNLGYREANLREALDRIRNLELIVTRSSSIYETEPVGYTDQPWFLNQVVELEKPTMSSRHGRGRPKSGTALASG